MTPDEKRTFTRHLFAAISENIEAAIDDMPEAWDGFEIRWYIADAFLAESETARPLGGDNGRARRREYARNAPRIRTLARRAR